MKMVTALPFGLRPLVILIGFAVTVPAGAQSHHRHPEHQPDQAPAEPADPHATHHQSLETPPAPEVDHSRMDHSGMDHSGMDHGTQHASHEVNAGMDADLPPDAPPRTPIPPISPADRAAAVPPAQGHATHDDRLHYYVIADRLESWDADEGDAFAWELGGWLGTDLDRLWIRSEGERSGGRTESADVELFYGRAIARWWDAVIGIRHDFGTAAGASPQTFAAFGVTGLAPYKFEVAATGYLGEGGQTGLALEAEYETLFTNRLIGQWLAQAELWGQDDATRGIGSGLATVEAGFRLRYEFHRQFAPYVGVAWERAKGGTADLRRAGGHDIEDTRLVVGLRTWF